MRSWIEPPEQIRPADWWEVATYIVLIALLLALMAKDTRPASEDTGRDTSVAADVVRGPNTPNLPRTER